MEPLKTKNIDTIFYDGKSLISKVIKWKTSPEFSHCEIVNNFEKNDFTIYGALNSKGVQFGSIDWHKKGTKYNIYRTKVTENQFKDFVEYLKEKYKKKYDYLGILGYIDNTIKQDDNKFYCSELIYKAFQHIGIELFNCNVRFPSPSLLSMSNSLKLIETGEVLGESVKILTKDDKDMQDILDKVKESSVQGDSLKKSVSCNGLTGTNFDRRLNNKVENGN